jgi:hypothetical protein
MARRAEAEGAVANGFGVRRRAWTGSLSSVVAAAGLGPSLVGVLYGVVRVGYEEYYGGLGLSPDVVGLDQAAIVARVGVVLGLAMLLVGTLIAFGVTIYRLAGR